MKKNALLITALLTSLSTVSVIPTVYAEDGMNMNGTEASTCGGCKKCKCSCSDDTSKNDDAAGSVDAMEDTNNHQGCSSCNGSNNNE
ncbi:MAG: hypothetical protein P1U32_01030 [Legionellaceae bacterium]|nr:hypothetical protein [Legionellaceae bacterium]